MSEVIEGKKILLVDDDEDILAAMRATLEEEGAEVSTVTNGNDAVTTCQTTQPDVVVLDMMLPGRSGFLVLEKIKAKKGKGVKPYVIMVTGNQGTRHRAYAETLGVDGYLNKPFRMDRLVKDIEKLLNQN